MAATHLLLIAEDSPDLRRCYELHFPLRGYDVLSALSGKTAYEKFHLYRSRISLVITDGDMPDGDGLWLASMIHESNPATPLILISGDLARYASDPRFALFERVVSKPFSIARLLTAVEGCLAR